MTQHSSPTTVNILGIPYRHNPTSLALLTTVFYVIYAFSLLPFTQCQDQGAASNPSTLPTTTISTISITTPPPITKPTTPRPKIVGGLCHFCDLCESLAPPNPEPVDSMQEACFNTDNIVVRCMTLTVFHMRGKDNDRSEYVRRCLNNGTTKCLGDHVGIVAEDDKCFKITVPSEAYLKYQTCNGEVRRQEWEQVQALQNPQNFGIGQRTPRGSVNGTLLEASSPTSPLRNGLPIFVEGNQPNPLPPNVETVVQPHPVEIVVCSCVGKLCNGHKEADVKNAKVVEKVEEVVPKGPGNTGISFYSTLLPGGGVSGYLVMMAVVVVTSLLN